MPSARCAVWYALENRTDYGNITIVYGARSVADIVCVDELEAWAKHPNVRGVRGVHPTGETAEWKSEIGFVPTVFERAGVAAENPVVPVIGSPIRIKNTIPVLDRAGILPSVVNTSLENRMKYGVGKCGRCVTTYASPYSQRRQPWPGSIRR